MRRIREILRLYWELNLGQSKVAESLGISSSTVNRLLHRAEVAGLSWPLPVELDDTTLEQLLYPPVTGRTRDRAQPNCAYIHEQLKQKRVTLTLLWHEYKEEHPDGYQLTQFCDFYREWRTQLSVSMRQKHRAGEKAFSDFAGAKFRITDPATGEVRSAHLFVSVLGASNFTFVDVFPDESSESWCTGQARAFEYFQGCPSMIVPDNPRAAVTKPCRYEPELNEAFGQMAAHFSCAVLPARVRKPKDKAKVECAVGVATRWIFAKLRNRDFFGLEELRAAIRPLLEELNDHPFKKLPGSRRSAFESIDRPALKPLPPEPYEYFEIHKVTVNIDHHVEFEHHWYSVPHQLVRKQVELRVTPKTIEVLHAGKRVASHPRSSEEGQQTTLLAHRPRSHQEYSQRSPQRLINWASTFGPATTRIIELAFEGKTHPEEAYNRCFGILKLGKHHGADRLEAACQRGLASGAVSYKSIKSILQSGLDRRPLASSQFPTQLRIAHQNIRGAHYFTSKGDTSC